MSLLKPLSQPSTPSHDHVPEEPGSPRWMREAFAYEPETKRAETVSAEAAPAPSDPNVRILSRVSPRR